MMILWLDGWEGEEGCMCAERVSWKSVNNRIVIGLNVYKNCPVHAKDRRRYSLNPDKCECRVVVDKNLGYSHPVYYDIEKCAEHRNMSAHSPSKRCTCEWGFEHHGPGLDEPMIHELDPFCFEHSHYPFDRAYMK